MPAPSHPPEGPSLRYRYQTIEFGDIDIHLRSLRDRNQFDPDDGAEKLGISSALWPIFGMLWDSGHLLADLMVERNVEDLRILEVGCGLGLASLVLNRRDADVTATDRHPSAERMLKANTTLNDDPKIPFERADWAEPETDLGRFDLIIGSDLLYDRAAVEPLFDFLLRHVKERCELVLVGPGRGGHMGKLGRLLEAEGFSHDKQFVEHEATEQKMRVHTFRRRPDEY